MIRRIRTLFSRRTQQLVIIDTKESRKVVPEDEDVVKAVCTQKLFGGEDMVDERCPICFEEWTYGGFFAETKCGHTFCVQCLEQWFERQITCPKCRNELLLV